MTEKCLEVPMGIGSEQDQVCGQPAYWGGVYAISLCVFALIASEFLPVSLLTPIAAELHVSEGLAGYSLAVSAAFAVLTSLSASTVAGTMDRKTLLLLLTGLMCASGLVVGLARSYEVYIVGRALIGVVVGGFWSMSAAVAMRLVPAASVPRALAIFNGGNALATVIAAPLGSYLATVIGWRGAFLCLVPIGLVAMAWQWRSLPVLRTKPHHTPRRNAFHSVKSRFVILGLMGVGTLFMGRFMLFTYVRPFLETGTRVTVGMLSVILMLIGASGFVGTLMISTLVKKSLYRTLLFVPLSMAAIAIGLVVFGRDVAVAVVLLGLWGLVSTAAPVAWWSWLAQLLPNDAETGGGLMVAVIQFSIALGSATGGLLFDSRGYSITFTAGACVLMFAALLAWLTSRTGSAVRGHKI